MSNTETMNDKQVLLDSINSFFNMAGKPIHENIFTDTLDVVSRKRVITLEKLIVSEGASELISEISDKVEIELPILVEFLRAAQNNDTFASLDRKETLTYAVAFFSTIMNTFVIQKVMQNAERGHDYNTLLEHVGNATAYLQMKMFNQVYQYVATNNIERSTTSSHMSTKLRSIHASSFYIKNETVLAALDLIKRGLANADTLGYVACVCPLMRKPEESVILIHDGVNHPLVPINDVDPDVVQVLESFDSGMDSAYYEENENTNDIVLENPSVNHTTVLPELSKVDYNSLGDIHMPFNNLRDDSVFHMGNTEGLDRFRQAFNGLQGMDNTAHYTGESHISARRQSRVAALTRPISFDAPDITIANANNFMDRFNSRFRAENPEIIEMIASSNSFTNWVVFTLDGEYVAKTYNGIVFTGTSRGHESLTLRFRGFRPIVDSVSDERRADARERSAFLAEHVDDVVSVSHDNPSDYFDEGRTNWNIPFKKIRDALRLNKVVLLNSNVRYYNGDTVNEQGYNIPDTTNMIAQISGEFAFRRNADTSFDVLTTELNLRCSCNAYQVSQNCRHLLPIHRGYIKAITQGIRLDNTKTVDVINNPVMLATDIELEKKMKKFFFFSARYGSNFAYGVKLSEDNSKFTYLYAAKPDLNQNDYPLASSYMQPYGLIPGFNDPSYVQDAESFKSHLADLSLISDLMQQSSSVGTLNSFLPYLATGGDMVINQVYKYSFVDSDSNPHNITFMLNKITLGDAALNNMNVVFNTVACSCVNEDCVYVALTKKYPMLGVLLNNDQTSRFVNRPNNVEKIGMPLATLVKEGFTEKLVALNHTERFNAREINEMASYATLLSSVRHISDVSNLPENIYQASLIQYTISENNGQGHENGIVEMYRSKSEMLNSEFAMKSVNMNRRQQRHRANSVSFTHNIETYNREEFFDIAYRAKHEFESGNNPLPYNRENVIHTPAEIQNPITFGVEIEYDFPEEWSEGKMADTNETIAETLHALGYIPNPYREGYHSGLRNGYTSWSFERDSSVTGGELVSPILSDTPESWAQIEKICSVLKTYGAIASNRTGLHVHVGTEHYGNSTAKYAELVRTLNNTQETIYRLAKSPLEENHRGYNYCAPNTYDIEGNIGPNITRHIRGNSGHSIGLNLAEVNFDAPSRSHVEFRMWDATLLPQVIQQQVKLSIALVLHATHKVTTNNGHSYPLNMLPKTLGSNHIIHQGKDQWHNLETFMEVNEDAYALINEIFPRAEDRESITQLLAINNWIQ